jgi:phosphoglycolate phosphatase
MRLVIFDLDGTLIDSVALIVETMTNAFADAGMVAPDEKTIRSISGIALKEGMQILAPGATEQQIAAIVAAYRVRYVASEGRREPLFAGALAALDRLHAEPETILAVATGKGFQGATTLLTRHGIVERFNSIETPTHNLSKPDPQMIDTAIGKSGVSRKQVVMVGDTVHDMRMARRAGVKGVGVAWGYHEPVELREAGADIVIESFDQLDAAIDQVLGVSHA